MQKRALAVAASVLLTAQHHTFAATKYEPSSSGQWGDSQADGAIARFTQRPVAPSVTLKPSRRRAVRPRHRAARSPARATRSCEGLPAKWQAATDEVANGRADLAYGQFRKLLATCTSPDEAQGTAWKAADVLPSAQMDKLLSDPIARTPAFANTFAALELRRMYEANAAGDYVLALSYSRQLRNSILASRDGSALRVSGWLETRARNYDSAETLFWRAMEVSSDPAAAREGLASVLFQQNRLDEAAGQARGLNSKTGRELYANVLRAQVHAAYKAGEYDKALTLIGNANDVGMTPDVSLEALKGWALLKVGDPAAAQQVFASLHQAQPEVSEYADGLTYAAMGNHDYGTLVGVARGPASHAKTVASQALGVHYESIGYFSAARELTGHSAEGHEASAQTLVSVDEKSGTPGQGRLTALTTPQFSLVTPVAGGSVKVDATEARLDDGMQHTWGERITGEASHQFPNGVLTGGAGVEAPGHGPVKALGKVYWRSASEAGDSFYQASVTRDSILDSVRSYEGNRSTVDPTGPAVSTAAALKVRKPFRGTFFVDATVVAGAVTASNTAVNPFYSVDLSFTRDFQAPGWSWLNAGADARASSYRYDANRFDGAYGGYWSPKSNREAGFVLNAQSEEGRSFIAKTGARMGFASRELYNGRASGLFGEDTTSAAALISERVIVGAGVGVRASPGYHEVNAFAWVKIPFEARHELRAADLTTPLGF